MTEDSIPVRPRARRFAKTLERRDVHFIDQMAKKGRLGEDLLVKKPRRGLERNGRQLFQPMQPARGMDVQQR
jgi:hypothetical protein